MEIDVVDGSGMITGEESWNLAVNRLVPSHFNYTEGK